MNNIYPLVQLNNTVIPGIPFLWYREQELVCPIDYIGKTNLHDVDFVIVQRNISDTGNLYICLHSLMYCKLHQTQNDGPSVIPRNFNRNINFEVMIIPLNCCEIKEIPRGLQINKFTSGNVFIHDCAFSPPGCLHFKVNNEKVMNEFICVVKNNELQINIKCLFILFNDLKGADIDLDVKNFILTINKS